jgi:hypothetical protein
MPRPDLYFQAAQLARAADGEPIVKKTRASSPKVFCTIVVFGLEAFHFSADS